MEADNPYVHLSVRNKILVGRYTESLHITLEMAREIVRSRHAFTQGASMATIIIARGITGMDKAARDYLSSAEATEGLIATALVISSRYQRIVGNFFIRVNKTAMPVRMFNNEDLAEKWLEKFIN